MKRVNQYNSLVVISNVTFKLNGCNNTGKVVASGIYYYQVMLYDCVKSGNICFVR